MACGLWQASCVPFISRQQQPALAWAHESQEADVGSRRCHCKCSVRKETISFVAHSKDLKNKAGWEDGPGGHVGICGVVKDPSISTAYTYTMQHIPKPKLKSRKLYENM